MIRTTFIIIILILSPVFGMEIPFQETINNPILVDFIDSSTQSELEIKTAEEKKRRKAEKFQIKIEDTLIYFEAEIEKEYQTTSSRKTDMARTYPITKKRTSINMKVKK
jgi:hypothetical protein